jgi:ElaB/YqjD/DUF883 family membrane-anchored ribosome-binding protein
MANTNVDTDINQLKSDVAKLRKDMADLMGVLKDAGAEQGREVYNRAYQQAQRTGQYARERATQAYDTVGKEVEDHPLTSVLTAFGTGFVVGIFLDWRNH